MGCIGRVASGVVVGCVLVLGGAGAGFGQIVINEVMYDPSVSGDVNAEWFELYNSGTDRVDVHGWKIKDDTSTSETHHDQHHRGGAVDRVEGVPRSRPQLGQVAERRRDR